MSIDHANVWDYAKCKRVQKQVEEYIQIFEPKEPLAPSHRDTNKKISEGRSAQRGTLLLRMFDLVAGLNSPRSL